MSSRREIEVERKKMANYENRKVESEPISVISLARNSDKNKRYVTSYDRLSNLPEPIVHHIYSFLDPKDIAMSSTLSKAFEQLCLSYPRLCFKGLYDTKVCIKKCKAFSKSVNSHLVLRNGAKLECLDLEWRCKEGYLKVALLNTWIHEAVRCQVEVLHLKLVLNLIDKKPFRLPGCIFECPSLREFELDFNEKNFFFFSRTCLKLPSVNVSSLQILSLGCFQLEDNVDLGNWICTICKTLKKLTLDDIRGLKTLSFRSTSLEDLSVRSCFSEVKCVTISAAKLHNLSIDAHFSKNILKLNIGDECVRTFNFEGEFGCMISKSFAKIDTAVIDVMSPSLENSHFLGTLQAVSQCRVLNLNSLILRKLYSVDQQQVFFENVQELVINVFGLRDDLVPIVGKFLRGLPNLTTLFIKCKSSIELSRKILELDLFKETKENEESQNTFFRRLKEVELEIYDKDKEHTGMADYLMQHAICLEKMTLVVVKMK